MLLLRSSPSAFGHAQHQQEQRVPTVQIVNNNNEKAVLRAWAGEREGFGKARETFHAEEASKQHLQIK
jgi:hypothetical protein